MSLKQIFYAITVFSGQSDRVEQHMSMSLKETNLGNDLHGHIKITGDDVFYIRSENNPGLVKEKCMENKYSAGSLDIGNLQISLEEQKIKLKHQKKHFLTYLGNLL